MIKTVQAVEVFYEGQRVGLLARSPERRCLFEYDTVWLREGFSISPFYLPLKSGVFTARSEPFNGLFGVFNDSLPDGWGRLLIDRWLIANGKNPDEFGPVDRLTLVGGGGMGALTYRPAQMKSMKETNHRLDFYAAEVDKILHADYSGSLDELVKKAASSGGARPKVLIKINGEDWLVKFRSSFDPENVGKIEYEHSLLAKKCGIEMPETRLFENKYFGVRRFDRDGNKRTHVHSAAGLLYASYRLPSLDYSALMKATMALTRNMIEVEKIFRVMVFNVLIGNKDDHAKNFAFVYKNRGWQVSPAYDLLPSAGFNNNHTTTINGKGKPDLKDCFEVARTTGFPEKKAQKIIDEVTGGLK
jgi:serine/threonine-protein kinase HipA